VTPQQLEEIVLAAIDHLKDGGASEDDRIEFKRAWPEPKKARQLAAAANRNRGNPLIYVIGVDDRTGRIQTAPSRIDVASWWAGIEARFDQIAPEMLRHLTVYAGPGEAVTVLLFATDRAPYVVKAEGGGSPEYEVPLRDGTRTRSAHRHELLRMLVPAVGTPPVVLLDAEVGGQWLAAIEGVDGRPERPEGTHLQGRVTVFFEHGADGNVLLPLHQMSGELTCRELRIPITPRPHTGVATVNAMPFGVDVRPDGVVFSGPGRLSLPIQASLPGDHRTQLGAVDQWQLSISLGVTGAAGPVRLRAILKRAAHMRNRQASEYVEPLPQWTYVA